MANIGKHSKIELRDLSIWLDGYNDIFSDFDPRPYEQRALSDDFISEVKKRCNENEFDIEQINLLVPEQLRDKASEEIITRRLETYIKKNYQNELVKRRVIRKRSVLMIVIGLSCMAVASYLYKLQIKDFIYGVLMICFEPAGWFLVWTGLDDLLSISKRKRQEMDFYNKLHNAAILFKNSE